MLETTPHGLGADVRDDPARRSMTPCVCAAMRGEGQRAREKGRERGKSRRRDHTHERRDATSSTMFRNRRKTKKTQKKNQTRRDAQTHARDAPPARWSQPPCHPPHADRHHTTKHNQPLEDHAHHLGLPPANENEVRTSATHAEKVAMANLTSIILS